MWHTPTCKKYAPVLYWKTPCMFWPSLLACVTPYVFSLSPPVCFSQFCMVLPAFLHSLPRLNGLERGVCQLSVPPFAGFIHLSCVESSMYVLTFKWLSYVKKVVLRRYASFFWNQRAWMCHLSVPWQPPKKCLATQKRLTPCWFLCEAIGFEDLLFIFRSVKEGKTQPSKR